MLWYHSGQRCWKLLNFILSVKGFAAALSRVLFPLSSVLTWLIRSIQIHWVQKYVSRFVKLTFNFWFFIYLLLEWAALIQQCSAFVTFVNCLHLCSNFRIVVRSWLKFHLFIMIHRHDLQISILALYFAALNILLTAWW